MKEEILIVTAIRQELFGLSHELLPNVRCETVGVGGVESAVNLERILQKYKAGKKDFSSPHEILLLGSAGKMRIKPSGFVGGQEQSARHKKKRPIFFYANSFSNIDVSVCLDRARLALLQNHVITTTRGKNAQFLFEKIQAEKKHFPSPQNTRLLCGQVAHINSTNSITKYDYAIQLRKILSQHPPKKKEFSFCEGWGENLEAYALAYVAFHHQIPFTAFLAVTNDLNEAASTDWQRTHEEKAEQLNTWLCHQLAAAHF